MLSGALVRAELAATPRDALFGCPSPLERIREVIP
jgi:hypothetical protein